MDFKDIVNKSLNTNEQLRQEVIKSDNEILHDIAESFYNGIKDEIVNKASLGEHTNGIIKGISHIPIDTTGIYFPSTDLYKKYFSGILHIADSDYYSLIGLYHVYRLSLKMNHVNKILKVFNILLGLCKQDGISISQPFLHMRIYEIHSRKLLKEAKLPIKNWKSKYSTRCIRYMFFHNRDASFVSHDDIYLAVEYEFSL